MKSRQIKLNRDTKSFSSEKQHFLQTLQRLDVFPKQGSFEKTFPFFDKTLLPLLDYLTIRDLFRLADDDVYDPPLFAVFLCMFDAVREGSLCLNIEKESLISRMMVFAGPKTALDTANKFLDALDKGRYDDFVSRDQDRYKPLVLCSHQNGRLLYFQKYYVHEKKLQTRISRFLDPSGGSLHKSFSGQHDVDKAIGEIFSDDSVLRLSKDGPPIAMDPYQVDAVKKALSSSFCIVSGGPGTGKTSLMVNMLRCFLRTGVDCSRIILCAPTGRAAQKMTEAIYDSIRTIRHPDETDRTLATLKASTIHKVLHYRRYLNDFFYQDQNPLPASLVVMDEVSMVDVVLMEKFIRAVDPSRTRLVLLGDKDQLPPVDAGAVFGTMIPDQNNASAFKNHFVVLKNTYRSGKRLQDLAGMINQGKSAFINPVGFQQALNMENDQWALVDPQSPKQWEQDLIRWADKRLYEKINKHMTEPGSPMGSDSPGFGRDELSPDKIFPILESSKILTLVRKGVWGSEGINRFLCGYLSKRLQTFSDWRQYGVFSGEFIIIVKNDYAKNLYNGDTGVVLKDSQGVFRAFFKRVDSYIDFPLDFLPAWEPAYALTVHKCQGSEFDDVLVVLPSDDQHRLLTRQMIYTAVTRARKRVVIYGRPSSFKTAVKNKIHRESGLMWDTPAYC